MRSRRLSTRPRSLGFDGVQLRGVNLGGWLLLERWITPSLFEGTDAPDEWTFMQTPGARERLDAHRASFITTADFSWLRSVGVNAVRIPVGYWILDGDPPYAAGIEHLDRAYELAAWHGIRILLDLHGAPGSQNGQDHSGRQGHAGWFTRAAARERTVDVAARLDERYREHPSHWGLQLLNEPPVRLVHRTLRQYYQEAASRLEGPTRLVFHDAFMPRLLSGALGDDERAVLDTHLYHMTSFVGRFLTAEQWVRFGPRSFARTLRAVRHRQPVIVGEWSGVLRGETLRRLPKRRADALTARYLAAQRGVFDRGADGWFYWTYRTEHRDDVWNFRALVKDGHVAPLSS